jgi:predicted TIM-barrel fold metal-dependent hydrolase
VTGVIDVHQHLWPELFVDRLRARAEPPYLDGWTLHTSTEPPYEVDPADHALDKRVAQEQDGGADLVGLALSSPLGIEADSSLLEAWHAGAAELPEPFRPWAAASSAEPDLEALESLLGNGFLGLQLPSHLLGTPRGWARHAPLLALAERLNKPVLIHPGPTGVSADDLPGWWAPLVDYTAQLHAAWWAWHAYGGRADFPDLRLCFVAAAGLAPVHHERLVARGGRLGTIDPNLYVDTSGYGPQGVDAVARVLGIDQVVHGTDRPYAEAADLRQGDAATAVIRHANPYRFLFGAGRNTTTERGVQ